MHAAMLPHPHMSAWDGVYFNTGITLRMKSLTYARLSILVFCVKDAV
jgi:hypothetical protein